ncbi:serine hydrolase domain-containing protein [uncultured Hymenobacter sp.]|uniref:serine hydrolase domain-containing protein n=1 Tax=uncultured Hymenobacter sp. TaxID=170016 RepID=UPI0035CBE3BF
MKLLFTLFLLGLTCLRGLAQTGIEVPELAPVDETVRQFMQRWNVLGASVALTKDGRLVYDRAFGYADAARTVPLQPYQLLRVASVSKTVTALAILKLVEEGQLSLTHKVFGPEGYLSGPAYSRELHDPRLLDITVQHLLEHSAGWDRRVGCDNHDGCDPIDFPTHVAAVMHVPNPVGDSTLIRYLLRQGLNYAPGTRYAYSNIGYLVLGKVLEAVTQQPYEAWVRAHVLQPSGVLEAHLGRNRPADRLERESSYLSRYRMTSCYDPGQQVPAAYGGYQLEAMSAHGGWLFSARDLARLALAADGFGSRPDLLAPATLNAMTQPSAAAAGYGQGWMLDGANNWYHTGQLDGTASLLMRTARGYTWAILLNTANGSAQFWRELQALGWDWLAAATSWPAHDLFAPDQNAAGLRADSAAGAAPAQLSWTNGSGTHRLLLLKAGSSSTAFPLDGTAYPPASRLADGTIVIANGVASTTPLPALDPQRSYYARVVEYRQDAATGGRPVYTLDANPRLVLPPAAGQSPPLALRPKLVPRRLRAAAIAAGKRYPLAATEKNLTQPEDTLPAPAASAQPLPPGPYLLRIRRALRASVLHLVRL